MIFPRRKQTHPHPISKPAHTHTHICHGPFVSKLGCVPERCCCASPALLSVVQTCLGICVLERKAGLSVEQLETGIRQEYAKNYLWTGDINEALYEVRGHHRHLL